MKSIPYTELNCVGSLLKAAKKLKIEVSLIDKKTHLRFFSKGNRSCYVKNHVVDINSGMSSMLTNDKFLTKKLLKKNNIPVPAGFRKNCLSEVLNLLNNDNLRFPLVVKPIKGCQGGAVTVDINNNFWLEKSILEVHKYNESKKGKSKFFLVEESVKGADFRFLVLDGETLTVMLRKPAYVMGDGKSNIKNLVDEYNKQPGVAKNQPLCPILRDYEFERNLVEQNLNEQSVPKKNERIVFRKSANVSTGGRSFECFKKVHFEYFNLMKKIVKIFGIRFCAIDIIAEDIGKYEKFKIIEVNDTPGFDIHEVPFSGKPFRVAESLLASVFFGNNKI